MDRATKLHVAMEAAGYLSVDEVAHLLNVDHAKAAAMLAAYYDRFPEKAERERNRLANQAKGSYY